MTRNKTKPLTDKTLVATSIRMENWCDEIIEHEATKKKWPKAVFVRDLIEEWCRVFVANNPNWREQ